MSKRQKEDHLAKGEYKSMVGTIKNSVIGKPEAREVQQAPSPPRIHEEGQRWVEKDTRFTAKH